MHVTINNGTIQLPDILHSDNPIAYKSKYILQPSDKINGPIITSGKNFKFPSTFMLVYEGNIGSYTFNADRW